MQAPEHIDTRERTGVRRRVVWGAWIALGVLLSAVLFASCTSQVREGQSTSYLIIDLLEGASGAEPDEMGSFVLSDVRTIVDGVPTFFNDPGQVTMRLGLKDPGPSTSPIAPTPNNFITVNRFRVVYTRTDGRNTAGVDVPFPIEGAVTFTVGAGNVQSGFELVRNQAKQEPPLRALIGLGSAQLITTIAEVTFYGHDQAGRQVSVTGRISVTFADFGDPS
jgi:hypothetical protein